MSVVNNWKTFVCDGADSHERSRNACEIAAEHGFLEPWVTQRTILHIFVVDYIKFS